MKEVKHFYIYITSLITLQVITWALVALLRNLFDRPVDRETVALLLATLVIGLPLGLTHWLWAQRLARDRADENLHFLRRLFLAGMMASLLGPWLNQVYNILVQATFALAGDLAPAVPRWQPARAVVINNAIIGAVVLGGLWFYFYRIWRTEAQAVPDDEAMAGIRRANLLAWTLVGLALLVTGAIGLSQWTLHGLLAGPLNRPGLGFMPHVVQLLLGVPLWYLCWQRLQARFAADIMGERTSLLRKLYLYGVIGLTLLMAVGNLTIILTGIWQRIFQLPPTSGVLEYTLPLALAGIIVSSSHLLVLRADLRQVADRAWVGGLARIFRYTLASIGLGTTLIGVGGLVSIVIRQFMDEIWGYGELSWFLSLLIVGLPVWLWPWYLSQAEAGRSDKSGIAECASPVRRTYLFSHILVATLVILFSGIYLVFRAITWLMGLDTGVESGVDIAHMLAFAALALGIWLYHGWLVRRDGQIVDRADAARFSQFEVAILDAGDGHVAEELTDRLRRGLPGIHLHPVGLTAAAAAAVAALEIDDGAANGNNGGHAAAALVDTVAAADVIVGPWLMAVPGADSPVSPDVAAAIQHSHAHKIILPAEREGWEWAGGSHVDTRLLARNTMRAIRALAAETADRPEAVAEAEEGN